MFCRDSSVPIVRGCSPPNTRRAVGKISSRVVAASRRLASVAVVSSYARLLYRDPDATLDELREAVTTLDDAARIAQRVFGVANPMTKGIESDLRNSRKVLRAREDGKKVTFKIVKH